MTCLSASEDDNACKNQVRQRTINSPLYILNEELRTDHES